MCLHRVFFLLGKQQPKPSQCFERLLKKKLWATQGFTNGFRGSDVVTCHLKTNRDLGFLQQAEPTKTFKKIRYTIMFYRRRTIDELEALPGVFFGAIAWPCAKKTPRILEVRWVASASWQCSRPHSTECAAVSHEKRDDSGFAPPYSPDQAPFDFFLFPRMKRDLKGMSFQNVEEVRPKTTEALKAITLQEFQNCFEQWKKRWNKCIDSQGEYVEGDYILKIPREIYDLKKNLVVLGPPRMLCDYELPSSLSIIQPLESDLFSGVVPKVWVTNVQFSQERQPWTVERCVRLSKPADPVQCTIVRMLTSHIK